MDETNRRAKRLRDAGLRVTAPRLAILSELERNRTHPSAEEVHLRVSGRHPSLSVSTVYLTLEAFVRAGLARRLPGQDGRLRVDGTDPDHDHAVCLGCGEILDVPRARARRPQVRSRLPHGVKILDARVEYEVLCARCQPESRVRARSSQGLHRYSRDHCNQPTSKRRQPWPN